MTHDEFRESLPAFALDVLDPHERAEVASHLAGCESCAAELVALHRVVQNVGLDAPPVTPPAGLKARVIARVAAEAQAGPSERALPASPARQPDAIRRPFWNSRLALAASVMLAAAASLYAFAMRAEVVSLRVATDTASGQVTRLRDELATLRRERVTLQRTMDVLRAPDVLRVDLKGQTGAPAATGHAFWSRRAGLAFAAEGLPALPEGRVYQLWAITGSSPVSAGTFVASGSGDASVTSPVAADAPPPDAFGVTIEPTGGSATPTMPIVLIGAARR